MLPMAYVEPNRLTTLFVPEKADLIGELTAHCERRIFDRGSLVFRSPAACRASVTPSPKVCFAS